MVGCSEEGEMGEGQVRLDGGAHKQSPQDRARI